MYFDFFFPVKNAKIFKFYVEERSAVWKHKLHLFFVYSWELEHPLDLTYTAQSSAFVCAIPLDSDIFPFPSHLALFSSSFFFLMYFKPFFKI